MNDAVLAAVDRNRAAAAERLGQWLTIPSVSTDPARADDVRRAAAWARDHLQASGLNARLIETAGHPVVYAESIPPRATTHSIHEKTSSRTSKESSGGEGVTVLYYGHYDVQPPDPLERWSSQPFEPVVRDGQLFARGACDDKGQAACILESLRAWHDAGQPLPCRVKVLLEGEEEIGSKNLPAFLEARRDLLAADVCLISDTSMWPPDPPPEGSPEGFPEVVPQSFAHVPAESSPTAAASTPCSSSADHACDSAPRPAICYALRGLVYFDIQLHGPARDLHSGVYGGSLANPATMLTRILGRLFDDHNRITIPGFYDDVAPPPPDETAAWERLNFNEAAFFAGLGTQPFGEAGFSTLQRKWIRPACDINGLYGGFMQPGAKTIIPAFAGAKVSFRIPTPMDPRKVARQFTDWLHAQDTGGCTWAITPHGEAFACATPIDSPWIAATRRAVEQVTGRPAALVREGATIPIVADLQRILHLHAVLLGFGLAGDQIHSPDEHFSLDRLHLGTRVHAALLDTLAAVKDSP